MSSPPASLQAKVVGNIRLDIYPMHKTTYTFVDTYVRTHMNIRILLRKIVFHRRKQIIIYLKEFMVFDCTANWERCNLPNMEL